MRNMLLVVGALLALGGLVFFLQGIGVLPGSFMTGQSFWAWAGLVLMIAGVALAVVSFSRRGSR